MSITSITVCDRCRETDQRMDMKEGWMNIDEVIGGIATKCIDLCPRCRNDFELFMQNKLADK